MEEAEDAMTEPTDEVQEHLETMDEVHDHAEELQEYMETDEIPDHVETTDEIHEQNLASLDEVQDGSVTPQDEVQKPSPDGDRQEYMNYLIREHDLDPDCPPVFDDEDFEPAPILHKEYLADLVYRTGAIHILKPPVSDHDYGSRSGRRLRKQDIYVKQDLTTVEQIASNFVDSTDLNIGKPRIDQSPARIRMEAQPIATTMGPRILHPGAYPAGETVAVRRAITQQPQIVAPRFTQPKVAVPRMRQASASESAPQLHAIHRPDPPPHRIMDNRPSTSVVIPKMRAVTVSDVPQPISAGIGRAPLLMPSRGSKPHPRGQAQVRLRKEDGLMQEGDAQRPIPAASSSAPNIGPMHSFTSPRKVHFNDMPQQRPIDSFPVQSRASSSTVHILQSPERRLVSPVKSPPQDMPIIPRSMAERSPHHAVQQPVVLPPKEPQPLPLPDNIIDDPSEAPPKEPAIPSHLAEMAISLMGQHGASSDKSDPFNSSEGNVKERIAAIKQSLKEDSEKKAEHPAAIEPKRPKNTRIERTSISSNSSSNRTAASTRLRVPGASPVRTNLDFNSRLAVPATDRRRSVTVGSMVGTAPSKVDQGRKRQSYDRKKKKHEIEDDEEEEEGEEVDEQEKDWTTRCICGFEDNHELMVECDGCHVWQHCLCIGMSKAELDATDSYFCEQCDQTKRTPNPARARSRMAKELGKPATPLRPPVPLLQKPPAAVKSVYTKNAKNLLGLCTMQNAFEGELVPSIVARMKVGPKHEGLVAEKEISAGIAVAEIVGAVSLPFEIGADRDRKTFFIPYVFLYDGLGLDSILALDARKINQDGRYVRRSCKPNSAIQHCRKGDVIRFFIVSRNQVNRGEEITIPFDVDNQPSATVCQCHPVSHDCLILKGNFIGPGHRIATIPVKQEKAAPVKPEKAIPVKPEKAIPVKPETPIAKKVPKKNDNVPRSAPAGARTARVSKEEKSEEESVAGNKPAANEDEKATIISRKRGKTVTVKQSEKEENIDGKKRVRRHSENRTSEVQELQRNAQSVNFILPSERNKANREERKLQMMLSRFDKATQKSKEKKEQAKAPEKEKRVRLSSSASDQAQPALPSPRESKRRNADSDSKDETMSTSTVSSSAMSPPSKKLREDERGGLPAKKAFLRRHQASSEGSEGQPEPRKSVSHDSGENEIANVLADMPNGGAIKKNLLLEEMRKGIPVIKKKLEVKEYTLPTDNDFKGAIAAWQTPVRRPFKISTTEKKTEKPISALVETQQSPAQTTSASEPVKEEPAKPPAKRMSVDEYKQRKKESGVANMEPKPIIRKGFIPEMDEDDIRSAQFLMPIPLPRLDDRLSRPVISSPTNSISTRTTRSSVSTPVTLAASVPTRTTPVSVASTSATPARHLSLADRLGAEFGVGTPPSSKKQDNSADSPSSSAARRRATRWQ